jgi:stage II sporulation protein D
VSRRQRRPVALLLGALFAVAVYANCRSTPVKPRDDTPRPSVTPTATPEALASPESSPSPVALLQPAEPAIRVGLLTDAARPSIGADSGVLVWSGSRGSVSGQPTSVQRATFVPASSDAPAARFRVQVASVTDADAAERLARLAERAAGQPALVRWSDETRTYQVRVGAYATREEAQGAATRLRAQGLSGAWTPASLDGSAARLRLVETGQEFETVTVTTAQPGESLRLDAATYRGNLELRAGASGGLTVINHVGFEDYVRGVVPNELSPVSFGQIEALKAQAVAARTYALRNLGQFTAQGYDICATPACQVYKGQSSEHPLSDQAVAETAGLVALHRGRPIVAYYTSTCGGHTEDDANVFDGDEPYLKGVACAPEQSAWSLLRTTAEPLAFGRPGLGRDVALLTALGVIEARYASPSALEGTAREGELRRWLTQLGQVAGRAPCEAAPAPPARRAGFWRQAVSTLCWGERAERLLAPGDPEYLLRVGDRDQLETDEIVAAALLMSEGLLRPDDDGRLRPGAAVMRAEAVALLAGLASKLVPPALVTAEFRGAPRGALELSRDGQSEVLTLAPDARLFRDFDGRVSGAAELALVPGDAVEYVAREGRVVFLEAEQSPRGPSADRGSRYFRWEVRATPGELQKSAGTAFPVADVQPRRFGVSGRVVELALVGRDGAEQVVRGLRIRSALGLRENLFVIERERDDQGGVQRFVFTGKGWGHGVGLCQVGAFGLARAGSTFEQILKHYYSGVTLGPMR